MKLAICGHGKHGKDSAAKIFAHYTGLSYVTSTSWLVAPWVRNALAKTGVVYATLEECFADRENHRLYWAQFIDDYNTPDAARLYRECLEQQDILTGVRRYREIEAVKQARLCDLYVWIEKPGGEIDPTQEFGPERCDITILNDGALGWLEQKILNTLSFFDRLKIAIPAGM